MGCKACIFAGRPGRHRGHSRARRDTPLAVRPARSVAGIESGRVESGMIQSGLLAGYLVLCGVMGLAPLDSQNWILSSILPLTFVGALVFGRRVQPLSTASYLLIGGFLAFYP